MTCPFCRPTEIIMANARAYAIYDRYPVNPGHMLIIPKRHIASYFNITAEERKAVQNLLTECSKMLDREYAPDGYNIGVNCGAAAGQTIFHVHVHLIPRYRGDIENPQGGVRGVIPQKRIYED